MKNFEKKENERKREYNKTYRILNPVKVKESLKKATGTYRQSNSDKVKQKKITYRKSNPEKTKDSFKKAFATYRLSNLEKSRESSKNSSKRYNQNYPERVKDVQKRNYMKRKLADNETRVSKRPYQCNDCIACETPLQVENNYGEVRSPTTIAQLTETFHGNISVGPGEGNRPLGTFTDKDSEFLSFPTIYCGKCQADNNERLVPVHYSTMCKWELRSKDRRVAQSVPNIFYKLKKLQIRQIQGSASLSLRKCKTKGKTYTAGDLKSESSVNKLINLDEGFRVLRNLRGSPPYFERCKKDLFAMIRQLGNPTWFCSFSAAKTRWTHLIKILGRLNESKSYTDDEVRQMSWQKKSELIQKDPVTCARNFDHMVQLFIHDFIKSSCHPIGEVVDSPHIHGLFWIKNAPEYGRDCDEDIIKFVDRYVSCKADVDYLSNLVNLQRHKHSETCKKKGHATCRFNFPLMPMP